VVQAFFYSTHHRNELRAGPLKAVPDLDAVIHKMHRPSAGLDEVFRLYLFVRSIPSMTASLQGLVETITTHHLEEGGAPEKVPASVRILCERYVEPLQSIAGKFALYEQLVEHVVDLSKLPDLRVNAVHDSELQEIEAEQAGLTTRAERVLQEARSSWASFADVKLEQNPMHGFILRTTRGDDERQLRANCSSVRVISILKNGVHFTTPALERIAERYLALQGEYDTHQAALVGQALETARTYLPVVEAVAALIAEVDVLVSFATAAALAPGTYVRPTVLKRGSGVINLKVSAL
jgi:DNA mismatch repair protein MSH2